MSGHHPKKYYFHILGATLTTAISLGSANASITTYQELVRSSSGVVDILNFDFDDTTYVFSNVSGSSAGNRYEADTGHLSDVYNGSFTHIIDQHWNADSAGNIISAFLHVGSTDHPQLDIYSYFSTSGTWLRLYATSGNPAPYTKFRDCAEIYCFTYNHAADDGPYYNMMPTRVDSAHFNTPATAGLSAVPLPPSAFLFGAGLLGIIANLNRKRIQS
jgi:hypothetical protein